MKKIIVLLISIFIISTTYGQNIEFGLKGGLGLSNFCFINTNLSNQYNPIFSYNVSGYFRFKLSDNFGLIAEPGYILKGAENNNSKVKNESSYINAPILLDYLISKKYSIYLGPEFSYLVNNNLIKPNNYSQHNLGSEFSGTVGINYELSSNFDLGIRYNIGIKSFNGIVYNDKYGTSQIASGHIYYFQIYGRYKFKR